MAKYLDSTGLTHLWAKIKSYVATYVTNLNLDDTYVAQESGKGLSTNDYTTAEKSKLAGIASGAEVNVNADWNAASGDAQILNKPTIPSKTSQLTNDSNYITIADVPEGAVASSTTPKMDGTAAVGTETAFARGDHRHPSDTSKQDTINDLATIRSGAAAGATAYQLPSTGIPDTDLSSGVQASLAKADSAMQSGDLPVATTTTPKMDGTAAVGSETKWAKGDHVHPTDTTRAALASPTFTGTPKAPTASAGTNTTQIATTAFVKTAVDNSSSSLRAYKTVSVGDANISAASNADTITLEAGSNVTLTADTTNKKVTITATDTTYSAATQSANGLMSSTDKTKLDGIATGAEANVVKSVDTTAGTSGINLSLTSGKLDVTISSGSIASGNSNFVTGGTVYSTTSTLAPKASPALTGTPTAPTATAGTNTTQIATTAFVKTAVDAVTTTSLGAIPTTQKGVANGVATLDGNGLVPSSQLPSFVDDVIEAYARSGQTALSQNWLATGSASGTVITPEAGKIYVLMADSGDYSANSQFRWGGTAYVKLNDGGVSAITNAEIDSITSN